MRAASLVAAAHEPELVARRRASGLLPGTLAGQASGGIYTVPRAGGPGEPLASDDRSSAPAITFLPES
ncbi:MAG: hypothetical protein OHK0015_02040 [Chloroflexi bacterium OHK40]